jgi:transcription factor-like protein
MIKSNTLLGAPLSIDALTTSSESTAYVPYASPLDLNEAAKEYHFDEYEPEDNTELSAQEAAAKMNAGGDWEMFDHLNSEHSDTEVRDYNTYIHNHEGMLNHYDADNYASPLKNDHAKRVFLHFVSATSVSISIFERPPRDACDTPLASSAMPSPGLWSWTIPMMALNNNPGLLHATLALSSLHIARLQNGPETPAMKHYAYSIKRIHSTVGKRNRRQLISTLAATLLLAFYEVMTAEHSKWCWHLRGAAILITEIDYRRMSYRYRVEQAQESMLGFDDLAHGPVSDILPVDDRLVNRLMGREIRWIPPEYKPGEEPFDAQKYETYQDLFWWYCRQDTYQSIISGNRLL